MRALLRNYFEHVWHLGENRHEHEDPWSLVHGDKAFEPLLPLLEKVFSVPAIRAPDERSIEPEWFVDVALPSLEWEIRCFLILFF